jgi:peptidyl-dipeptidase Dcp
MTKIKAFQLEKVLNGAFTIAQKLYGLTFTEVFDIDKYHPEMTYEVTDEKKRFSGYFLCRFLSSKKKTQRCMDDFVNRNMLKTNLTKDPYFNVCNFTPPTESNLLLTLMK